MHDPKEFRDLARRCRERAKHSLNPDAVSQLRRWAAELADAADEIERATVEPADAAFSRAPGAAGGWVRERPCARDGTDASRQRFARITDCRKGTND